MATSANTGHSTNTTASSSDARASAATSSNKALSVSKSSTNKYLSQGLDGLQSGIDVAAKFIKDQPYVGLGLAAVAGYFLTSALMPSSSSSRRKH